MKILVIEDMQWIRKGIIKMLDKLELNMNQANILEASNGCEAIDICKEHQPALIITDIKMPYMNGLEFIKEAKSIVPMSEFIIITGYAEFNYASQAVNLGVKGFLLKPINDDKFKEVMTKALDALEEKQMYERMIEEKNHLKIKQQQIRLENILNKIYLGKDDVCWKGTEKYYALIVLRFTMDYLKKVNQQQGQWEAANIERIKEKCGDFLHNGKQCDVFLAPNYINSNELFILLSSDKKNILKVEQKKLIQRINENMKEEGLLDAIATSNIKEKVTKEMYNETKDVFVAKLFSEDKLNFFHQIKGNKGSMLYKEKFKLLKICIEKSDLKQVKNILDHIFNSINGEITYTQFMIIGSMISNIIFEAFQLSNEEVKQYKLFSEELMVPCNSINNLIDKYYVIIEDLTRKRKHNTSVDDYMIDQIKDYVQTHYMENITASIIAEYFNISLAYLSTVFKKNTEENLSAYITNIRIQKACELLRDSSINVSDISMAVGYQDVQYFYRVFKKNLGKTPLNYRKEQRFG